MEEPGEEGACLVGFAGGEEGGDTDAGIAWPGVAVVPVADPADPFRQRGRRGGHRRTRRRVREELQRQQAAHHGNAVVRDVDGGGPGSPGVLVAGQRRGGDGRGHDDERATAGCGENDRHGFTRVHLELHRAVDLDGGTIAGHGDGAVAAFAHQRAPPTGDAPGRLTVVPEAWREVEPGAHRPPAGGQPADEHGSRQEPAFDLGDETVGELELATLDRPCRHQGHRVVPIGAGGQAGVLAGTERERAGLIAADQPTEQRRVVEARHTPPVDRAVGRHERGGASVADQAVVADRNATAVLPRGGAHQLLPRNNPSTAP